MDDRSREYPLAEMARQLHCCSRQLRSILNQQLRPVGLSDSEFLLLWICHEAGQEAVVQGSAVTSTGLSPAQLSGLTDRLHKQGLIHVERCDNDRRRQMLRMTEAGQDIFRRAQQSLEGFSKQLRNGLGDLHTKQFMQLADQFMKAAQEPTKALSDSGVQTPHQKGAAA